MLTPVRRVRYAWRGPISALVDVRRCRAGEDSRLSGRDGAEFGAITPDSRYRRAPPTRERSLRSFLTQP